jgi:hypothetical protein
MQPNATFPATFFQYSLNFPSDSKGLERFALARPLGYPRRTVSHRFLRKVARTAQFHKLTPPRHRIEKQPAPLAA